MRNEIKLLISHNFLQMGQCEVEQTEDKYKNTLNKNFRTVWITWFCRLSWFGVHSLVPVNGNLNATAHNDGLDNNVLQP